MSRRPGIAQALVLAAGLGTRLDPLTRVVAKPAVPFGDRLLIERTLDWLQRQGVRDVVLNLHHHPATITRAIGDGAHLGLSIRYSWEPSVLGSAGGPRHALPLFADETFLIVNGDTYYDFDLQPMIRAHVASGAAVTIAVVRHPAPAKYNGFQLDHDGVVRAFVPKGAPGNDWHFIGVQVVRHDVFAGLADSVPADTVADVYDAMIRAGSGSIRGWEAAGQAVDIGTPRDYLNAALVFARQSSNDLQSAAAERNVVLWPDATIESGADVDRCIVLTGTHVPSHLRARDAILAPVEILRPGDAAAITAGIAAFAL